MGRVDTGTSPRKLGGYELLREIGQGGMGVVYLARQPSLERLVVLKKIRRDLLGDPSVVDRFQLEAQAAAAIQHQNVVAVHDCFSHRGDQYIAQEWVAGCDLQTVLTALGRIDPAIAMLIALEVARGLEEIHARGIIHRDLKPANILIGQAGEIKIADFGIALGGRRGLTRPGMMLGSIPYMSPEQMQGKSLDARSDLFSFGILLHELLAGSPPYEEPEAESLEPLLDAIQRASYLPARKQGIAAPRHLDRLIRLCLRMQPARRVQSATQIRHSLERRIRRSAPSDCREAIAAYLVGNGILERPEEQTEARRAVASTRGGKTKRRVAVAVLAGIALVGAAAVAHFRRGGSQPEQPAEVMAAGIGALPAMATQPPNAGMAAEEVEGRMTPAAVAVEPAQVRFTAYPWAEITVGDARSFLTPRAAAVELEPGTHRVIFEHPSFGRAEYTLALGPGEQRSLRHVYEEADEP
jgi:hypothetical protein